MFGKSLGIIVFLLLAASCSEKTPDAVYTVEGAEVDIEFLTNDLSLRGVVRMAVRNDCETACNTLILWFHPSVKIQNLSYNNSPVLFDSIRFQKMAGVKASIPAIAPRKSALVEATFSLQGPIREHRFFIGRDYVFLEMVRNWFPVPVSDANYFNYRIRVTTPESYAGVLGGELEREWTTNGKRTMQWRSELPAPNLTANLIIGNFTRAKSENIFYYGDDTTNIEMIIKYTKMVRTILTNRLDDEPFTQYHLINCVSGSEDLEGNIDGEFLGSVIHFSPDLFSRSEMRPERDAIESIIPFVPYYNRFRLLEIIAHESSHGFISLPLNFSDENSPDDEPLVGFCAFTVIHSIAPAVYRKFLESTRIYLVNLWLQNRTSDALWSYLYRLNVLGIAFNESPDRFFTLIQYLKDGYRFIKIGLQDMINTAESVNRETLKLKTADREKLIDINAMRLWNEASLYNISVRLSNETEASGALGDARTTVDVEISNTFPTAIRGMWIARYYDRETTNQVRLENNRSTYISVAGDIRSASFVSTYSLLEYDENDNHLRVDYQKLAQLNRELNRYLSAETERTNPANYWLIQTNSLSLLKDRYSDNPYYFFDKIVSNEKECYIYAYRLRKEKADLYLILHFTVSNRLYRLNKVYDWSNDNK